MRNFKDSMHVVCGAAVCALIGGGCVDSDPDAQTDDQPRPIATLDVDGKHLDFFQPTPGSLVLFIQGTLSEELDGKSPQAIYEALSGQPAPAVVRDAVARIEAAHRTRTRDVDLPLPEITPPDHLRGPASLAAAEFAAAWCNPGPVDFDYCWTNTTNNATVDITSVDWIHAHMNEYLGEMATMSMYVKHPPFGSWNLINSATVVGDATVVTFDETDNGTYRVQVTGATGDHYHLAIHGDR